MKLLFVIVGLLAVSVELASAAFNFNDFFKPKPKPTPKPAPTTKATSIPATTAEPRRRHFKKAYEVPYEIYAAVSKTKAEADFLKMFGLKPVAKKDEVGGQVVTRLAQSGEKSTDIIVSWEGGSCIPRLKLVNFGETMYNLIAPQCISVKRCGGCCFLPSSLQHCVPVKSYTHNVAAYFYSHAGSLAMSSNKGPVRRRRSNAIYMSTIPVEVHTKCECQCVKSQSDCTARQHWIADRCECACLPRYSERELDCKYPIEFNPNTCKCECVLPPNNNCDLGKEWSHEACKCVCKPKKCKHPEVLNPNTCKCGSS